MKEIKKFLNYKGNFKKQKEKHFQQHDFGICRRVQQIQKLKQTMDDVYK